METRRQMSIEAILVMFLMIMFAASTCVMIIQGSRSYETIIDQKAEQEGARIAMSFINMRVKQNDIAGQITYQVGAVEGQDAIVVKHSNEESGYVTYIYYLDGTLYECYTDVESEPNLELSTKIVDLDGFAMAYDEDYKLIRLSIPYQNGKTQMTIESLIHLRSWL